jgi:hypothetical protein
MLYIHTYFLISMRVACTLVCLYIYIYVYIYIFIYIYINLYIGHGVVVCSHSYNTETDLDAVRKVLEQPNMQMAPGKHYSFSVGQLG